MTDNSNFDPHFYDPRAAEPTSGARPAAPWVYLLAVAGGLLGILAAIYEESQHGAVLSMIVFAPAVEEVCKPLGVLLMVEKRPHWLRSRVELLVLALLSAGVFASLENLLYITVYHPGGMRFYVLWRLVICTGMHLTATFIFSLGLAKAWRERMRGKVLRTTTLFRYWVAAACLHAAYNTAVLVAGLTGVLTFD